MTTAPVYAAPFAAIDQVELLDATGISTLRTLRDDELFFAGHYPDLPIFPGVFIIESIHQATRAFVAARLAGYPRLVAVDMVRFLAPLAPGDSYATRCRFAHDSAARSLRADAGCARLTAPAAAAARAILRYELVAE